MNGWLVTHENCLDGATAALIGLATGLEVVFVEPDRVPDGLAQISVDQLAYLADVSLKRGDWARWGGRVAFLLDHHQSALELVGLPNVLIDQSRSGAQLMYDYAKDHAWIPPSPSWDRLCRQVQQYDLWQPQHDFGQNLNRLFHHLGFSWYRDRFGAGWTPFTRDEGDLLAHLIDAESQFVKHHVTTAIRYQKRLPFPIYGVELEDDGPVNLICHTLIERGAGLVLVLKPDRRLSVRSDGRVNAAQLMETLYHGGGHARAAGGRLTDDRTPLLPELLEEVSNHLAAH